MVLCTIKRAFDWSLVYFVIVHFILKINTSFSVPGDGGSQIEAKLVGKPAVVHYVCQKATADYFDMWLNLELFLPYVIDCWVDNMK